MRRIVLAMMTTLNGRLDDPGAWVHGVSDDQYQAIERNYATFDTVLAGRTTYEEMAGYWPGVLSEGAGTATNRSMARRMNDCKKLVFSKSAGQALTEWNNVEQVIVANDEKLLQYLMNLKLQNGGDVHLSGGASFAQSVIALGQVDEFHFFVYPVVSPGAAWFSRLDNKHGFLLLDATRFENGTVRLRYVPQKLAEKPRPDSFTELLT